MPSLYSEHFSKAPVQFPLPQLMFVSFGELIESPLKRSGMRTRARTTFLTLSLLYLLCLFATLVGSRTYVLPRYVRTMGTASIAALSTVCRAARRKKRRMLSDAFGLMRDGGASMRRTTGFVPAEETVKVSVRRSRRSVGRSGVRGTIEDPAVCGSVECVSSGNDSSVWLFSVELSAVCLSAVYVPGLCVSTACISAVCDSAGCTLTASIPVVSMSMSGNDKSTGLSIGGIANFESFVTTAGFEDFCLTPDFEDMLLTAGFESFATTAFPSMVGLLTLAPSGESSFSNSCLIVLLCCGLEAEFGVLWGTGRTTGLVFVDL